MTWGARFFLCADNTYAHSRDRGRYNANAIYLTYISENTQTRFRTKPNEDTYEPGSDKRGLKAIKVKLRYLHKKKKTAFD